eukprot:CAMPEP_0185603794 /NCGR_PEP_ID=MMETSP0436-20130131/2801_1 /TAXON_ID=626734 ORGANISM="Favella taraikaensis, Strain Fe Narragansett Bay" /NCGR_SAMPLE_ID=MMETSP0436 /ASSEMBLY_ACC=CAM_ASM_000390 /LENGTH=163 /DNA_ID=CAMNT_0028234441 /DNA_START=210 /DNA_END=700 /DNA_ORIENTATION=+
MTRKDVFSRNYGHLERKYGEAHRKAFGPDAKINLLGYPDMGNNLFSDLLPYSDWVKLNNAAEDARGGLRIGLRHAAQRVYRVTPLPKNGNLLAGLLRHHPLQPHQCVYGAARLQPGSPPRGAQQVFPHRDARIGFLFSFQDSFSPGTHQPGRQGEVSYVQIQP